MPDDAGIMGRYLKEGINQIDCFLRQEGALRLAPSEVRSVKGRDYVAGWQFVLRTPLADHRLSIFVDRQFPFSPPHFILLDRPPFLEWPHVGKDGLLCLPRADVDFRQPDKVVGVLLSDANKLICESESGSNKNDFRVEFDSYWNRGTTEQRARSLLTSGGPSRLVRVWRGKKWVVVGETEEQVLAWLRNLDGNKRQFDSTDPACLLWINEPLLPSEYPKNAADLYRIASSSPGGIGLLECLANIGSSPFYFLIGAESGSGPCFAAVRTCNATSVSPRGKRLDHTNDGFRPGRVPAGLRARRLFSSDASVSRMAVERVDADWIHGRGRDSRQRTLNVKTVLLFGCGSVGAPIAHQLAMGGAGRILLVDPDELTWANVGRHPLGADHVGSRKAGALSKTLQKAYPHSRFEGFDDTSHCFFTKHPALASQADIVVCATADWPAESELNIRQVQGEISTPVLFVWTEPHACAGHAVLTFPGGPCLQCGFSHTGECKLQITTWPAGDQSEPEPACGAVFQPYGPIELLGTISVGASLALDGLLGRVKVATHRIWAGPETLLTDAGGSWTECWVGNNKERAKGGFQEDRTWERNPDCSVCGGSGSSIR